MLHQAVEYLRRLGLHLLQVGGPFFGGAAERRDFLGFPGVVPFHVLRAVQEEGLSLGVQAPEHFLMLDRPMVGSVQRFRFRLFLGLFGLFLAGGSPGVGLASRSASFSSGSGVASALTSSGVSSGVSLAASSAASHASSSAERVSCTSFSSSGMATR